MIPTFSYTSSPLKPSRYTNRDNGAAHGGLAPRIDCNLTAEGRQSSHPCMLQKEYVIVGKECIDMIVGNALVKAVQSPDFLLRHNAARVVDFLQQHRLRCCLKLEFP